MDVYMDCFQGGHSFCQTDTYVHKRDFYVDEFIREQALDVLSQTSQLTNPTVSIYASLSQVHNHRKCYCVSSKSVCLMLLYCSFLFLNDFHTQVFYYCTAY